MPINELKTLLGFSDKPRRQRSQGDRRENEEQLFFLCIPSPVFRTWFKVASTDTDEGFDSIMDLHMNRYAKDQE